MDPTRHYAPATDTTELPAALRGNPPTAELHLLDLRPSVPTRHYVWAARLARLWARLLASPFADDLRASYRAAFGPAVAGSAALLALWLLWVTRGHYIDWTGFQPIPTTGKSPR